MENREEATSCRYIKVADYLLFLLHIQVISSKNVQIAKVGYIFEREEASVRLIDIHIYIYTFKLTAAAED